MIVYKIRDTETGLYSGGGARPHFSRNGKSWTSTGPIRNHQRCWCTHRARQSGAKAYSLNWDQLLAYWPKTWIIVSFELVERETIPIE